MPSRLINDSQGPFKQSWPWPLATFSSRRASLMKRARSFMASQHARPGCKVMATRWQNLNPTHLRGLLSRSLQQHVKPCPQNLLTCPPTPCGTAASQRQSAPDDVRTLVRPICTTWKFNSVPNVPHILTAIRGDLDPQCTAYMKPIAV